MVSAKNKSEAAWANSI